MSGAKEVEAYKYNLEPGCIYASTDPTLVTTVVGTCVAVCLHDRRLKSGGMNHYLYPKASWGEKTTARYGNVAVLALIRLMLSQGSRLEDMEAQIFGGGSRGLNDSSRVGRKNVKMAKRILKKKGIKVVSEDVGGIKGRRVLFHTGTNETIVMKTHRIRRGDWHPYRERIAS